MGVSAPERREALKQVYLEARECTRCQLHQTRTTVVFGSGNADADLMFIGEAPGANEDKQGIPFVGQAGKLLDKLLDEIGLTRADVFVVNVLKCRPPGNRDPQPREIETCEPYLRRQVELIEPIMICTLGNFATKLLRGDPTGISRLHGREENLTVGSRAVRLFPIYHPAAALYTPSTLDALRADFHRIPEILELGPPTQPPQPEAMPDFGEIPDLADADADADDEYGFEHPHGVPEPAPPSGAASVDAEASESPAYPGLPPAQQLGLF